MNDGPLIDDRVARELAPHKQGDMLAAAARAAYRMGFYYLSWVYLFEREV